MKVVSTNIAVPQTVLKGKKEVQTGIFKRPVENIFITPSGVQEDAVMDRKYHGGVDKACYLYSADHYPFWKKQYPDLDWHFGMFGENITIEGLNEESIRIGDTFQLGEAVVQVSEPRTPCAILGIRFNDVGIIKKFTDAPYPGIYVRVLQEGNVKNGDLLSLIKSNDESLTVEDVYGLFSFNKNNRPMLEKALTDHLLSEDCKVSLRKRLK